MSADPGGRAGAPRPSQVPTPRIDHLQHLTGAHGLFEHALHDEPRPDHGYTTDDNARALVVMRRAFPDTARDTGFQPYLGFVLEGAVGQGWHNRMSRFGEWTDRRGPDDAYGRAIWGLGEVLASGHMETPVPETLQAGLTFTSPHPRSVSYALLGAVAAGERTLIAGLEDFIERLANELPPPSSGDWHWPEPRLAYDNARITEAMIRSAAFRHDGSALQSGLDLLAWLIAEERGVEGFSFAPVGGRGPDDTKPGFDQQPLEAWAMADACAAAIAVDDDPMWRLGLSDAVLWFLGKNDSGVALYDEASGAGFDGLEPDGANRNRGAESTLAALGSLCAYHSHTRDGALT